MPTGIFANPHTFGARRPYLQRQQRVRICLLTPRAAAAAPGSFDANGQSASSDDASRVIELTLRLEEAERALEEEKRRREVLAPFLVAAPKRGIIGNSRYAVSLRKAIVNASRDPMRKPVLIFGERGLEKDNVAALIHFGSRNHKQPMIRVDCERLDADCSDLLGNKAKKGLLNWLPPGGTLLLNNVHLAPPAVLPLLQRQVATSSVAASMMSFDEDDSPVVDTSSSLFDRPGTSPQPNMISPTFPRILMTAETRVPPDMESLATIIRVPPLRVRPDDIDELTKFILRRIERQSASKGSRKVRLSAEARRRLKAHNYPANIAELTSMVERAVAQTMTGQSGSNNKNLTRISEDVFWFASPAKDRFKVDLLRVIPALRRFLRGDIWTEKLNHGIIKPLFVVVVAILFIGPQDRGHNFALNAFWAYWWPLSFVVYPFLGRVWCSVCPFMIWGEVVQRWRVSSGAKLLKWPREWADSYGAWFLFAMFFAILVWEEVWDLPDNAALSSWLLLLITAGAMICSFFWERRFWCRYLCPVGGMNGLFGKLSMTELRARQGVCSSECDTYHCYKGGPKEAPEGLETNGCPVYSHPAQLSDNRNCVLCMECLKACPHRSIEFRLRAPAWDIFGGGHKPLAAEVALMYMLLGAVYLHHFPDVSLQLGLDPTPFLAERSTHILASGLMLTAPGVIAVTTYTLWQTLASATEADMNMATWSLAGSMDTIDSSIDVLKRAAKAYEQEKSGAWLIAPVKSFVDISYGLLPLVWTGTLAHYMDLLLNEAGLILPVAVKTVGLTPPAWIPSIVAHPAVTSFLQGSTLLFGAVASLGLTRRVGAQPWRALAPQIFLIGLFTAELWRVIIK